MTISFIDATSVEATSVSSMPSHQKGDLLVMFAWRDSTTAATVPSGWFIVYTQTSTAGASRSLVTAYKVAGSASETSGTWTNANMLTCAVFRDDVDIIVLGGLSVANGSTTSVTYNTILANTQANNTGKLIASSSVLLLYGAALSNNTTMQQTPANCTTHHNAVLATYEAVVHTTNTAVSSRSSAGITADVAVTTSTIVVELLDTGVAKTSAASFRPVNIRGGADQ